MLTVPIAVDIAVFRVKDQGLEILLVKRDDPDQPYYNQWALVGGTLAENDVDLLEAAHRTLKRRVGSDLAYVEQVATKGNATRDPRGWSVTTVYFALVAHNEEVNALPNTQWFDINSPQVSSLAFDHSQLLEMALTRVRNKSAYSLLPAYLLPAQFTYTELQHVYEKILSVKLEKSKFRTKLAGHPDLVEGQKRTGVAYRQPMLLSINPKPTQLIFPKPLVDL